MKRGRCAAREDEPANTGFGKGEGSGFADALAGAGDEGYAGCVEFHDRAGELCVYAPGF